MTPCGPHNTHIPRNAPRYARSRLRHSRGSLEREDVLRRIPLRRSNDRRTLERILELGAFESSEI